MSGTSEELPFVYCEVPTEHAILTHTRARSGAWQLYLPACGAIAVPFILEIRHKAHHPVVDLRQGESFLGGALNGTRDQIRVGLVAPRVPARRLGFAQLAGHIQRGAGHAGRGGRYRRRGAGWMFELRRRPSAPARWHVPQLHFHRQRAALLLRTRQRPSARPRATVRLIVGVQFNLKRVCPATLHH